MITKPPELVVFEPGEIKWYESSKFTPLIQFGITPRKLLNKLALALGIRYIIYDHTKPSLGEIIIMQSHAEYKIDTNGVLSVEELYPVFQHTVKLMGNYYNQTAKNNEKPEVEFDTPSIQDLRVSIQPIVDLFMAAAN